ncbi:MAG: hypothetical protein COA69_13535 [Robiginitomaculum sp.]|nr:MAG: hypothetical protein COA69_13535 [Robiginitomaculum sp.]
MAPTPPATYKALEIARLRAELDRYTKMCEGKDRRPVDFVNRDRAARRLDIARKRDRKTKE